VWTISSLCRFLELWGLLINAIFQLSCSRDVSIKKTRNWENLLKKVAKFGGKWGDHGFSVTSKDTSSNEARKQDIENPTAFSSPPSAPQRHRIKNEWFSHTICQTTRELFAKFTKQTKAIFKNEIKIWINRVTFFRISTTLTIAKLYACFYSLYLWRISYSDSNTSM
jgi:hypothetical protein